MLNVMLQAAQGGGGSMLIWMIVFFVLIWLLMMRPQQKKAKEERKFRDGLKKGDRVLLQDGIYGIVHEVGTTTVELEVSNGVIITVEKSVIQPVAEEKK